MMSESQELLAIFVKTGSEAAFRELVTRYIDLVYSTAVRLVDGDTHRAEDVAQVVFADLARIAGKLSRGTTLGGWLHRHTCFVARTTMRGERRRLARERQAAEMKEGKSLLAEAAPVLDEAINELPPDDREAIVLRFFERRSLRSVGEALGTNENVAQKRVARAVEELGRLLQRRGVAFSAAGLASGLAAGAVKAAPAGLAASIAGTVLANLGATGALGFGAAKVAFAAKLKLGIVGVIVLAGLVASVLFWNRFRSAAESEDRQPRQQVTEFQPQSGPAPDPVTEQLAASAPGTPGSDEPVFQTAVPPRENRGLVPAAPPGEPRSAFPQLPVPPRAGAPLVRFSADPRGKVRIAGTANIIQTNWAAESKIVGGFAEFGPDFPSRPGPVKRTPAAVWATVEAFVPVRALKSVNNRGMHYSDAMDEKMYRSLKAEQFPRIYYRLHGLTLKATTNVNNALQYEFDSVGELAIAGVTNRIAMPVVVVPLASNKLQITGTTALKMSSFNIKPPAEHLVLGTMKAGDKVNITFTWMLSARPAKNQPEPTTPEPSETPVTADPGIPTGVTQFVNTATGAEAHADEVLPAGAVHFVNADLRQVLAIYREAAQAQIELEERLETLPASISFTNTEPLIRAQLIGLLDDALLEQAGILVAHPETNRVTMRLLP